MTEILKMGERAGLGLALAGLALCAGCPTASNDADLGNDDGNAGDVPQGGDDGRDDGDDRDDLDDLTNVLFAIGPNMGIVGFDDAEALSGRELAVTTELTMSNDSVMAPRDAAVDRRGALYILSTAQRGSIAVYDKPLTASGGRKPDRMVFGATTLITPSPTGIAIDQASDLLYVSNLLTGVLVFDISVPAAFDGAVAPIAAFEVDYPLFRAEQIRVGPDGALYVVDARGDTSDILAFDGASARAARGELTGTFAPDRVISNAAFDNTIGIWVDAADRLLAGSRDAGQVLIFGAAASLDGAATPDVTLTITPAPGGAAGEVWPSFATTDLDDRLYIADASRSVVYVFDDASELRSGALRPDREIDSSELVAPGRLVVVER